MGSIIEGAFQKALISDVSRLVKDYTGFIDQVYGQIVQERTAVALGRDWITKRFIGTGDSGAIRMGVALNGPNEGAVGTFAHTMENPDTYPTLKEMTYGGLHEIQLKLVRASLNFFMPLSLKRVDALDAMKVKIIARMVAGFSRKIAARRVREFYKQKGVSVNKIICTVDEIVAGGSVGDAFVTIKPTSAQFSLFQDGHYVELWNQAGTTRRHAPGVTLTSAPTKWLMVDGISPLDGTITFKTSGGALLDSQVLVTDVVIDYQDPNYSGTTIVSAAQTPHDAAGLESFILDSGTLYGDEAVVGLPLATYGFLKSLVRDMTAAPPAGFGGEVPLSNSLLNRYVGAFEKAYPSGDLTHLVTTSGVCRAMLDGLENQVVYDAQGEAVSPKFGFKTEGKGSDWYLPFYSPSGKNYKIVVGAACRPKTLFGVNMNGNVFEIFPPDIGGSRDSLASGECEFIAPLLGSKDIWLPVSSGDAVTNVRQAPGEYMHAISCDDPRGIKLTGLQEMGD